ncbi:MAG: ankyrin repeat domain-containing protein [FCB group bacterium]|jgi:ankyrin repeat protein|nr:ankyrin repeat domain-containing protein [FCB group bacterium]
MKFTITVAPVILALAVGCSDAKPANKTELKGYTTLHAAAAANDLKAVEELLRERTPPDTPDAEGVTALHRAARDNQLEMTELLLRYHARPDIRTGRGWTALHLAAMKGRIETIEMLIRFGADATITTPEGDNALHLAVTGGDSVVVEEILRDVAAQASKPDAANPNAKEALMQQANAKGATPFQLAIEKGKWDVVGAMLSGGANPNATTKSGRLPLHEAVRAANYNAITLLMTYGAQPMLRDSSGQTAFDVAAAMNRPELTEFLARMVPAAQ